MLVYPWATRSSFSGIFCDDHASFTIRVTAVESLILASSCAGACRTLLPIGRDVRLLGSVAIYMGILLVPAMCVLVYFIKTNPELLERRMRFRERERTQKRVIFASYFWLLATFLLPGFDRRWEWSDVPTPIVLIANLVVLLGYGLVVRVFLENRYASRVIEVEAKQQVISTGPYAVIRHPMYLGTSVMYLATPLALGSYWAMIPAVFIIPILVARILNEE